MIDVPGGNTASLAPVRRGRPSIIAAGTAVIMALLATLAFTSSPAAAATGYWEAWLEPPATYNQWWPPSYNPEPRPTGHNYAFWASDGNAQFRLPARVCAMRLDPSATRTSINVRTQVDRATNFESSNLTFERGETNRWKCSTVSGSTIGTITAAACTVPVYRCNSQTYIGTLNPLPWCDWNRWTPWPTCTPDPWRTVVPR